jgi:hypothetical protein
MSMTKSPPSIFLTSRLALDSASAKFLAKTLKVNAVPRQLALNFHSCVMGFEDYTLGCCDCQSTTSSGGLISVHIGL